MNLFTSSSTVFVFLVGAWLISRWLEEEGGQKEGELSNPECVGSGLDALSSWSGLDLGWLVPFGPQHQAKGQDRSRPPRRDTTSTSSSPIKGWFLPQWTGSRSSRLQGLEATFLNWWVATWKLLWLGSQLRGLLRRLKTLGETSGVICTSTQLVG